MKFNDKHTQQVFGMLLERLSEKGMKAARTSKEELARSLQLRAVADTWELGKYKQLYNCQEAVGDFFLVIEPVIAMYHALHSAWRLQHDWSEVVQAGLGGVSEAEAKKFIATCQAGT